METPSEDIINFSAFIGYNRKPPSPNFTNLPLINLGSLFIMVFIRVSEQLLTLIQTVEKRTHDAGRLSGQVDAARCLSVNQVREFFQSTKTTSEEGEEFAQLFKYDQIVMSLEHENEMHVKPVF